jgi:FkbM family methyltransferase
MFNLSHLRRLYGGAKMLGLNLPDTFRWFWSYYASRLPGAGSRATSCVEVGIPAMALRLRIRNNGFDYDVVDEIFARNAYKMGLDNVKRVLDLGGNIGLASLFFARSYPGAQICTVEPIPGNLAILESNLKLNHVSVQVVPVAAGGRDGKIRFVISQDPRQHSSETSGIRVLATGSSIEVDMVSVPSLMKLMGWAEIDLLKIDIEGGETAVLGGRPDWLKKVRTIIGEGHVGVGYTIEACRTDLEPMGFQVRLLDQRAGAMLFVAQRPD